MLKCLICSGKCHPFVDLKLEMTCCRCEVCHGIFKSPDTFQDYDEQKKRYDLHQNEEDSKGYRAYFKRFLDFTLPITGDVRTALDFGSGASTLLAIMMKENGIDCDSYDPIYRSDSAYLEKSYDLIASVEVFEHLKDPKKVFEHLLSRLNDGGYLAIQTQFHYDDIKLFLNWHYRLDPTHVVFFAPETFRYLSDHNGCKYMGDNSKNMVVIRKSRISTSQ